jgi:hypothetical protein
MQGISAIQRYYGASVRDARLGLLGDPPVPHKSHRIDGISCTLPHDAADERFIQQKDEKPCARDRAPFPLLQFRSDTLRRSGLWEVADMVDAPEAWESPN